MAVSARGGPGQWSDLPRRLVSRLAGGLAARIEPPGRETRRRYVLDQARRRSLTLAADAVERLAEIADGYRTLDGLIVRLALEARLTRQPIDAARLGAILDEPGATPVPATIDQIARTVAAQFGVPLRALRSGARRQGLIEPRHLAMHLARLHTGASFAAIGAYFGGRDPATVRYACRKHGRPGLDPAVGCDR